MNLFFCERLDQHGGILGKDESHHAQRVLRLEKGDIILATEGLGIIYKAEILTISKSVVEFRNVEVYSSEKRKNYLHIAIAPTKSLDRFENFLEKATEIGVDEISPIFSTHSERKVYKIQRGKKVIQSAAKQSLSNWLPKLNEPLTLKDFIAQNQGESKYIAHCSDDSTKTHVLTDLKNEKDILMLIGPEGDFSTEEIDLAQKNGFRAVSLGNKRLRTETAGITVAIAGKIL